MVNRRTMRKPPEVRVPPMPGFAIGPHYVAAVDAAKHEPAWVLGHSGQIQAADFDLAPGQGPPDREIGGGLVVQPMRPTFVVLEASRSYGRKDAGKHGDIIAESIGGALCAGSMRADTVVLVHPDEWAGQTQKAPRHLALWDVLLKSERLLLAEAAGFASAFELQAHIEQACDSISLGKKPKYTHRVHNLLDAAGLYLFAVGRIKRGGGVR